MTDRRSPTAALDSAPQPRGAEPRPGEAVTFEAMAREHRAYLEGVGRRLCRNEADARDLVQDTFERALKHFGSYRQGSNGRSWLTTILHNAFIDRCRAQARAPSAGIDPEHLGDTLANPEPEEAPPWAEVTLSQVREAVAQIDPDFGRVYELHELKGRSYQEIAAELGIPKATVGTRIMRARHKLKALLFKTLGGGSE